MKSWLALMLTMTIAAGAAAPLAQRPTEDRRALRERLERRFEVVPLDDGVALRPRTSAAGLQDVRLIDVANGTIEVNGVAVSGRELRERVGSDADAILQLSYLTPQDQRALFAQAPDAAETTVERPAAPEGSQVPLERAGPAPPEKPSRSRRANGDRVRVFGDVTVEKDEEVTGQVIAVLGSVRIDGEVGDQVVAVLGSVELGPTAIVGGDIVSVGGRIRREPGAQARRGVTEVSLGDSGLGVHLGPWFDGWGPFMSFGSFGAVPRLIGSGFRTVLLLLLTGLALVVARRSVEASAQRISDNPVKATLVGLVAEILIPPVLFLTALVLAISFIGIPLLLLLPFVVLALLIMALVGFTATAAAIGAAVQRRFALGNAGAFAGVCVGVLVILSPLLLGRVLALAGWPATPFALLLVGAGFAVELLAWASGFGAVLTNTFTRWQAQRSARTGLTAPPAVP
jgi:hypothetical protein